MLKQIEVVWCCCSGPVRTCDNIPWKWIWDWPHQLLSHLRFISYTWYYLWKEEFKVNYYEVKVNSRDQSFIFNHDEVSWRSLFKVKFNVSPLTLVSEVQVQGQLYRSRLKSRSHLCTWPGEYMVTLTVKVKVRVSSLTIVMRVQFQLYRSRSKSHLWP